MPELKNQKLNVEKLVGKFIRHKYWGKSCKISSVELMDSTKKYCLLCDERDDPVMMDEHQIKVLVDGHYADGYLLVQNSF